MEIKTDEELESTGYRCLFECVKKRGIEPFLELAKDIEYISRRSVLIHQTIFSGSNDLVVLKKAYRDTIKYLKERKDKFTHFNFVNENVLNVLNSLQDDISLLDLYLENAKKLEDLKVRDIEFTTFPNYDSYNCSIYRNDQGEIIHIGKYYTDGHIESVGSEIVTDPAFNYSEINFSIDSKKKPSFVLQADNSEHFYQYRKISIENFGFDGTKLPTEEELQSYEIPKTLLKK